MLKQITFVFLFFLITFSFAQDLTATQKVPDDVSPGTNYTAEITINKGSVTGFIKFSQKIPDNFTASELENKGGAFTFKDGIVKILWFSPPAENEFTISYKVSIPPDASGVETINGRVYYFLNTHREFFSLEPQIITIGKATIMQTDSITTPIPLKSLARFEPSINTRGASIVDTINPTMQSITTTTEIIPTANATTIDTTGKTKQAIITQATAVVPTSNPTIIDTAEKRTQSTIEIKTAEIIPAPALNAITIDTTGKAKQLTITNPTREVIPTPTSDAITSDTTGKKTQSTIIASATEVIPITKIISPVKTDTTTVAKSTITINTSIKSEKKQVPSVLEINSKTPVAVISVGKTYRVQIGAFHSKPKIKGVPELTTVLFDNGITKYFSGDFETYDVAAKRKNELIAKGFQGAFIVSFENGKVLK